MNFSEKIIVSRSVVSRTVGDELVLLDLEGGTYFGLDPVGLRMWQLLESGNTLGEVCEAILGEYDVPREVIEIDLTKLVEQFQDKNLVSAA